jgi:hypothetical protein
MSKEETNTIKIEMPGMTPDNKKLTESLTLYTGMLREEMYDFIRKVEALKRNYKGCISDDEFECAFSKSIGTLIYTFKKIDKPKNIDTIGNLKRTMDDLFHNETIEYDEFVQTTKTVFSQMIRHYQIEYNKCIRSEDRLRMMIRDSQKLKSNIPKLPLTMSDTTDTTTTTIIETPTKETPIPIEGVNELNAATKFVISGYKTLSKNNDKLKKELVKMTEKFEKISTEFKEYKATIKAASK